MHRYPDEEIRPDRRDGVSAGGMGPATQSDSAEAAEFCGSRWTALVGRIQENDNSAMEELYRVFSRGVRYYLCRHLGPQELDDKVHDTFLIVVQAIQSGGLREPERLMGFVRTVVRRQVAAFIDDAVQCRKEFADLELGGRVPDGRQNPEQRVMQEEKTELMVRVLQGISRRDREILTRFYLYEQPQEQICQEMSLSETQFRLLKSRAKARFGELGRRRLSHGGLGEKVLRRASSGDH
ncbi:sigma-70 family RNA polymerase sigma factor [uncultured Paludibaculum sp.]|uniref:RNA polymerase sigma factor n=1 Tax=uncultured Paludibaculum sp. TaxID=1765020 RepID=UPI002AAB7313|nr:sigma-70 family RNA polymerase sigma factor [uncultured Paludibaculum sp.]